LNWLRAHFRKHRSRSPWDFCWRVAIEGLVVSLIVVAIPSILLDEPGRDFLDWPIHHTLIIIVILAPIFETLLLQALPVAIARWRKAGFKVQILASLIPFTLAHLPEGVAVGIGAGLIGGFYLAFNYVHWRERSIWTALWTTTLAHAIRNGVPGLLLVLTWAFARN